MARLVAIVRQSALLVQMREPASHGRNARLVDVRVPISLLLSDERPRARGRRRQRRGVGSEARKRKRLTQTNCTQRSTNI